MHRKLLAIIVFIFLTAIDLVLPLRVFAQGVSSSFASNLDVADQSIGEGDIVQVNQRGIVKSNTPYAATILGVVATDPTIVIHQQTNTTRAIVTSGEADVKVTAKNGGIKPGDFITSSEIPGVGEKSRQPGYVLGIAKTGFTPPNSNGVGTSTAQGTVKVEINVHYDARNPYDLGSPLARIFDAFTNSLEDQNRVAGVIRYVTGALIAFIMFLISTIMFTRSVKASIEAIGRNPLARSSIQFTIILNLIMTVVVSGIGMAIAILIIKL